MTRRPSFLRSLERNGFYASVVAASHLEELGEDIRSLHEAGLLDDGLYQTYMIPYGTPRLPRSLPKAKSIIVLAFPQSMVRTTFNWEGRKVKVVVPPTYFVRYNVTWLARQELKRAFHPKQFRFVRAALPLKLLAVRSGLAKYGRNNITYIPKYGSFHRLTAFYSDYESPVDYWQEKEALPLCAKCRACLNACPTGAIQKDRFQIRAEKCLTYLNEKTTKHAFPSWVNPSAHNSIIGCMRCQKACPYDRDVIGWYEDNGNFSEAETAYLLRGRFTGSKADAMDRKLKRIGLDLTIFPRNLKVLLDFEGR
jgi:epoxyqueuosine reductase